VSGRDKFWEEVSKEYDKLPETLRLLNDTLEVWSRSGKALDDRIELPVVMIAAMARAAARSRFPSR